jgi:hypothetical protein
MKVELHVDFQIDPLGCTPERVKELFESWIYSHDVIGDKHVEVSVDEADIQSLIVTEGE